MDISNYTSYLIIFATILGIGIFVVRSNSSNRNDLKQENKNPTKKISANVNSADLDKLIEEDDLIILDVRTKDEYESGHLPKSLNIDFYASDFKAQLEQLDKSKKYLLYCRSGNRSSQAVDIMKSQGFTDLMNLSGGINSVSAKNICTGNC